MDQIKSIVARTLIAVIAVAGLGFGIMAVGFAVVLGAAFALALRLAAPGQRVATMEQDPEGAPATA